MDMLFVRGPRKRLVSVGWENHILQAEFYGGKRYRYGGVPVEVRDKLVRSPYPDSLFGKIVIGKYPYERVDPPVKSVPPPEMDELPF